MKHDREERSIPYSFGAAPSAEVQRIDSKSWWEIFMQLVGELPKNSLALRLSDDPVYLVHGHYFSIRDVACKAIDAAHQEGDQAAARNYRDTANRLIRSFDRLAASRIRSYYDTRFARLFVASITCLLLCGLVTFLYYQTGSGSVGLRIMMILFVVTALACAVGAWWTQLTKRTILRIHAHGKSGDESQNKANPGNQGTSND